MTSASTHPMAWTNERLKLSCADGIGLKSLWRMIVLDNNSTTSSTTAKGNDRKRSAGGRTKKENFTINADSIAELLQYRESTTNNPRMSLLKFLAINALELSAPASPLLIQQTNNAKCPPGWLQLSGHPQSIAPTANGIVRKRISGPSDSEAIAYHGLVKDAHAVQLIPQFHGVREMNGDSYLELQNLLHGFDNPAVMDIKMGRRTFLESEVTNETLRSDLYKKMTAVDQTAPSADEHHCQAITKLRYMLFREQISSSEHHGFRVEALKLRDAEPVTDLKTMKCGIEVDQTIGHFVSGRTDVTRQLIKRLRAMRRLIEQSEFMARHEIVGSSVFIVYDEHRVGAWLIDFAKTRRLPEGVTTDHRRRWVRGNFEEGLLHGFDELIAVFENILARDEALAAAAPST